MFDSLRWTARVETSLQTAPDSIRGTVRSGFRNRHLRERIVERRQLALTFVASRRQMLVNRARLVAVELRECFERDQVFDFRVIHPPTRHSLEVRLSI